MFGYKIDVQNSPLGEVDIEIFKLNFYKIGARLIDVKFYQSNRRLRINRNKYMETHFFTKKCQKVEKMKF